MELAHAFLSLTDDGSMPAARSPRLAVAAMLVSLALSLAIPLGWLAGHPIAAFGTKIALLDDEAM